MKFTVLVAIFLMWSSWACAQDDDEVNPDRPSFSNSAHTVPAGHIQLEGGISRMRYGKSSGYDLGEFLVRVGVSDRVEIRMGVPSYLVVRDSGGRSSGADDSLIEAKFRLRTRDRAAFGVLASAILPTGSRNVAEHTFQPGGTFISDIDVKKFVSITSNVGYFRATNEGKRFNYSFAVSTINVSLQGNIGVFTEFYIYHQQTGPVQKYAATGVAWTFAKKTAFDIHGGVGLPHNSAHGPDHYIGFGISRLF